MTDKRVQSTILLLSVIGLVALAYLEMISYRATLGGFIIVNSVFSTLNLYSKYQLVKNKRLLYSIFVNLAFCGVILYGILFYA